MRNRHLWRTAVALGLAPAPQLAGQRRDPAPAGADPRGRGDLLQHRGWAHELKFGAGYREVIQDTLSQTISGAVEIELGDGDSEFILARDESERTKVDYTSLYAQDTLTVGNLTANLGLRYDKQGGELLSASAAVNPFRPDLMSTWSTCARRRGSASTTFGLTIGADLFNAPNESCVLQRNGRLVRANSDHVLEIVSPRILRLGVKVSLR